MADRIFRLNGRSGVAVSFASILVLMYAVYSWTMAPHVLYVRAVHQYRPVTEDIHREAASLESMVAVEQENLRELQTQFDELRSTLFDYEEAKNLINELETWARESQCTLGAVHIDTDRPIDVEPEMEKDNRIEAIESEVTLNGPFHGVIQFIAELMRYRRGIYLQAIELDSENGSKYSMQCRLVIAIYVLHE